MELGLSLGETMADAGRDLVLGLGMGMGVVRREDEGRTKRGREEATAAPVRLELDFGADRRARSSPEPPPVRLTLLSMVPSLGVPWASSDSGHLEAASRGFDVNRVPSCAFGGAAAEADEEEQDDAGAGGAAVSSPSPNNSAGSFPTDFSARGQAGAGGGGDRACSRASDEDDGGSSRKKLRLSKEQSAFLEESFKEHATLNPKQKQALAKQLNLRPRQVEVWFQNRRARTKLKQTEVDCEYLKRCCETLTEENRRLQKELAELRALKTVNPYYMHLPATTLSMCPSCERVASNSAPPAAASAAQATTPAPVAAPPEQRPSSFAALFSSPLNRPLVAQTQAPASS
ncbi:hypothetical protein QOZ80_6BG0490150 [Eleusine coracana subsp. coracana]|nr:hypothetical protein QOZ80_6BG0490150 [Eleusine coracana subsp. coracana]